MAAHYTTTTFRDRSKEQSKVTLHNAPITALNIADFLSDYGDLKVAMAALSLGVLYRDLWVGDSTLLDESIPTDPYAQREIGLRFHYIGNTTMKKFFITLPAPNLSLVTYDGQTDQVDITQGAEVIALVAAIEAIGRSPDDDAENITVVSAEVVGRNS